MRIAMLQTDAAAGDVVRNTEHGLSLIERAAKSADWILLPELWTIGCDFHHLNETAVTLSDNLISRLGHLARHFGVTIAAGTLPLKEQGRISNTMLIFSPDGNIRARYSKRHLFHGYLESKLMTAGDTLLSAEMNGIQIGAAVCYEMYFPKCFRQMAKKGTTLVLVPASWPLLHIEKWEVLVRARAIENGMYLCAVNMCGTYHGIRLGGHSLFVDPEGRVLVRGDTEEHIYYAEYEEEKYKDLGKQLAVIQDVRETR